MSDLEKRLRRLEQQMAKLDIPGLEEVQAAWGRVTENVKARYRGEGEPYGDQRGQDRETIQRWADAEGVDLDLRAEEAKQKLMNVERGAFREEGGLQ